MKITKQLLKEIIEEEIKDLLNERKIIKLETHLADTDPELYKLVDALDFNGPKAAKVSPEKFNQNLAAIAQAVAQMSTDVKPGTYAYDKAPGMAIKIAATRSAAILGYVRQLFAGK